MECDFGVKQSDLFFLFKYHFHVFVVVQRILRLAVMYYMHDCTLLLRVVVDDMILLDVQYRPNTLNSINNHHTIEIL